MLKEPTQVWNNCLELIRGSVNPQSFKTWFEPIKAVRNTEEILTIQVPNKFFYEWLEEHYVDVLKKAIRSQFGDKGRLEYQILVDNHRKIGKSTDENQQVAKNFTPDQIKNPFVIPGIKKIQVDPQLNSIYTFDTFIEGDCNKLARAAGLAIAKKPGGTAFNPLVIYGDVGLGKTHLAHAIGNEIVSSGMDKKVLYVSMEQFTNQVVQAIKNNAISDFMNFYQFIDILIVDDIQFLAKRPKTQEIFFNIFNALHQSGRQIIMTSDRAPKDIKDVEDRLISRFKWGLSADLQAPDFDTRLAILDSKTQREGIELPDDVKEFICYNIKNNIRELEGVMISVIAQSTLNAKEIDIDLAKEVIQQFVNQINKEVTIESISTIVADHFETTVDQLKGKTRKRAVVMARQLSMYLAKNYTNKSLKVIGAEFGDRDHSTVIYSVQQVQNMMDIDVVFKDTVTDIEKKIAMSIHS